MKFRTLSTLLLLTSYFLLPALSHAQLSPENALRELTETVSIQMIPEHPGPNSTVSISIESFSTDLNRSQITWAVNEVVKKSGLGTKDFSLQTGTLGQPITINILIEPNVGAVFKKTLVIQPGEVDLLWQGNTYTPPFYRGKALWSNQGQITLLAIPHVFSPSGNLFKGSDLSYKWSKNGTVLGNQSGVGKNSIVITDSVLSLPQIIKVEIFTDENVVATSALIKLTSIAPSVLIYEDNPLYGFLFNKELGTKFVLDKSEISLSAFPLFFSTVSKSAPTISYVWSTNNTGEQSGNRVTYRAPEDSSGSTKINLKIENSAKLLQSTERGFLVQFGNQNSL